MGKYEPFENVDELGGPPYKYTFLARDTTTDEKVVIKSLRPASGGPQPDPEMLRTLAAWKRQKEAADQAANGKNHVVKIHQINQRPAGDVDYPEFWCVRDYYASSLLDLLRIYNPRDEALLNFTLGIVRGLQQLRAAGRSHGNLLPQNVLIGEGGQQNLDYAKARVAITDLYPVDPAVEFKDEQRDLRDIGKIIYQLVKQQEITSDLGFPAGELRPGPEWSRLGKKEGEHWRDLCTRLLNPTAFRGQTPFTLDELEAQLAEWKGNEGPSLSQQLDEVTQRFGNTAKDAAKVIQSKVVLLKRAAVGLSAAAAVVLAAWVLYANSPYITSQPKNATVEAGQAATLRCKVFALGSVEYQWFVDGQPVGSSTRSEFKWTAPLRPHDAPVKVRADIKVNGKVKRQTAVAQVNVKYFPAEITAIQQPQMIFGQSNNVTIDAKGSGVRYAWHRVDDTKPFWTEAKLPIQLRTRTTQYVAKAFNLSGTNQRTVTLSLIGPKLSTNRTPAVVTPGAKVRLEARAEPTNGVTYVWRKDSRDLTTTPWYEFTGSPSSAGTYSLRVDFAGTPLTNFLFDVYVPTPSAPPAVPEIVERWTTNNLPVGTPAVVKLKADPGVTFYWKSNGVPFATTPEGMLTIRNGGTYSCFVSNKAGSSKELALGTISFGRPPKFDIVPTLTTFPGSNVVLSATKIEGDEPISLLWSGPTASITSTQRQFEVRSPGTITLRAANRFGEHVASRTLAGSIPTIVAPTVVSVGKLARTNLTVGTNVQLSVTATGTPPLTYSWYHSNLLIGSQAASNLVLTKLRAKDAGLYEVEVSNAAGTNGKVRVAELRIGEAPSASTNLFVVTLSNGPGNVTPRINGTLPMFYRWGHIADVRTNPVIEVSRAGDYALQVTNDFGEGFFTFRVVVPDEPVRISNVLGMTFVRVGDSGLYVGEREVSRAQYTAVTKENLWSAGDTNLPANNLSHAQAANFCAGLNQFLPQGANPNSVCRLPTIMEWVNYSGVASNAVFSSVPDDLKTGEHFGGITAQEVRKSQNTKNKYGIFDVLGNVAEWSGDGWLLGWDWSMSRLYEELNRNAGTIIPVTRQPKNEKSLGTGFRVVIEVPSNAEAGKLAQKPAN